jgi:hypothetical protein
VFYVLFLKSVVYGVLFFEKKKMVFVLKSVLMVGATSENPSSNFFFEVCFGFFCQTNPFSFDK